MFKWTFGKTRPDNDSVLFWGLAWVKDEQYLSLDFGAYYIRLDWGFTDV